MPAKPPTLILGSTSERRQQILAFFSLPFHIASSHFDEESIPFTGETPQQYAATLAQAKGQALLPSYPQEVILTADTVVYCHGKIYGKPKNRQQAAQFLAELSDQTHQVCTALALFSQGLFKQCLVETTQVHFHALTAPQIDHYLRKIAWHDKAGGYAIQQSGALLVKQIQGCFYNVMGLPLNSLASILHLVDIDLWHYL